MIFFEIANLCLAAVLCVLCARSDMREGMIYNKTLGIFTALGVAMNIGYYGYWAQDFIYPFLLNCFVVALVSLYLFYSHSFAGGDCKMTIVLALLYPARYYLIYRRSMITLVFAVGFAIFAGYLYLLVRAIHALVTQKAKLTLAQTRQTFIQFAKSYVAAMVYIALMNCILFFCHQWGLFTTAWISRCLCLIIAWCIGKFPLLKKKILVISIAVVVILISAFFKTSPISRSPESYLLGLVLLICQMTIQTTISEKVKVHQLRAGMILTTFSSVLMQTSITKGLPAVSNETLKSRLTQEEVNSIQIWAKATRTEELTIVKKIPFAIFIAIGFLSYLILWGIVTYV